MDAEKEMEIEWYRKNVVPVYKEMVTIKLSKEAIRKIKKKEAIDVPKWLR